MKKLLIAIVALAIPAIGMAQNNLDPDTNPSTATINVSAAINSALSLTRVSDLTFGNFIYEEAENSSPVIDADPSGNATETGATWSRGQVDVSGAADAKIVFNVSGDFDGDGKLELSGLETPGNKILVTLSYWWDGSTYTMGDDVELDNTGSGSLYIGGTLELPTATDETDPADVYSATITFTATYF